MKKYEFNTTAIHGGHEGFQPDSVVVPIYQSVAYPYVNAKEAAAISAGEKPGYTYGRWDNPTTEVFEKRMAALEGMDAAIATSSGMGAILLLAHHLLNEGDEIVSSNQIYGGTFCLFDIGFKKMGVKVRWVAKPDSLEEWTSVITPQTKMLFVESPSNPNLFIADIPSLAALAEERDLPLVADNTICTPALQRPGEIGADIVIHSATKYICGNATSIGGIICGSKELIDGLRAVEMRYLGTSISPFNAWLNIIGLEHLSLRMERHCVNAMAVATFLEQHHLVNSVNYPGLASNQYNKLARSQMKGCSSLLSFEIKGTYEDAVTVIDSLKLIVHATHLGTCKTIVTHPASTTHSAMGEEQLRNAGISPSLLRLSVGIEDEADIIKDIDQALKKIE
ncbi:MAG: O-acetylhomoserine aminocarboxypropyltransferase/cysteine synthase [bacterium]|nr:MAG: O-acetylhomoserine aminocarboxypropyltransferase/cysteine synthase [bacterium]